MDDDDLSPECLASLLGYLGRGGGPEGARGDVTAAQWAALHYMARANALSRTVSALADYQGTTRGTVSQTVKALVAAGYLRRARSRMDGRSVRFDLTTAGRRKLDRDGRDPLAEALARMPAHRRQALTDAARELASAMADAGRSAFGTCRDCRHHDADGAGQPYCRGADCALGAEDMKALCAAYAPHPRAARR